MSYTLVIQTSVSLCENSTKHYNFNQFQDKALFNQALISLISFNTSLVSKQIKFLKKLPSKSDFLIFIILFSSVQYNYSAILGE